MGTETPHAASLGHLFQGAPLGPCGSVCEGKGYFPSFWKSPHTPVVRTFFFPSLLTPLLLRERPSQSRRERCPRGHHLQAWRFSLGQISRWPSFHISGITVFLMTNPQLVSICEFPFDVGPVWPTGHSGAMTQEAPESIWVSVSEAGGPSFLVGCSSSEWCLSPLQTNGRPLSY